MIDADTFLKNYPDAPGINLNMVIDERLRFAGDDNSSRSISNQADKMLLLHLRKHADLVITDSKTALSEHYRASKWVEIEVWSRSGIFGNLQDEPETSTHRALRLTKVGELSQAISKVRAEFGSILLETGPTLTKQIANLSEIDRVYLTLFEVESEGLAESLIARFKDRLNLNYLKHVSIQGFGGNTFAILSR